MVAAASGDGCEIVEVATIAWWQLGFLLLGYFAFFFLCNGFDEDEYGMS